MTTFTPTIPAAGAATSTHYARDFLDSLDRSDFDGATSILLGRITTIIRGNTETLRNICLLQQHFANLEKRVLSSDAPQPKNYKGLERLIGAAVKKLSPDYAAFNDQLATSEGRIVTIAKEVGPLMQPGIFSEDAITAKLHEIADVLAEYYTSIAEFEQEDQILLTFAFQSILFEALSPLYEYLSRGPVSFDLDQFKTTLAIHLSTDRPKNPFHNHLLESFKPIFFPFYPEKLPDLTDPKLPRPFASPDATLHKNLAALHKKARCKITFEEPILSQQVTYIKELAERIVPHHPAEERRVRFASKLIEELLCLYEHEKCPIPKELNILGESISKRSLSLFSIDSPEKLIQNECDQLKEKIVPLMPQKELETLAKPFLLRIELYLKRYKESYTDHDRIEHFLLDKEMKDLAAMQISELATRWNPITYSKPFSVSNLKMMLPLYENPDLKLNAIQRLAFRILTSVFSKS